MKRIELTEALHARPANLLVRLAARFDAIVRVKVGDRSADASRILEVLALGALGGTELVIAASGDGAAEAADHLAGLVTRLG